MEITTENVRKVIDSCEECQKLELEETLCNNDRLPRQMLIEAGAKFSKHLFTHFPKEADN